MSQKTSRLDLLKRALIVLGAAARKCEDLRISSNPQIQDR
jgi:hypothetical protein